MARRRDLRTALLYGLTLARQFRGTLALLLIAVLIGGALFRITPHAALGGRPSLLTSLYCAWMALYAQTILSPPETWYLALLDGVYPLIGFGLIGEGVVRLGLLIVSRQHGEKEWMKVMASTYRDHVVLCGLGHLGFRILQELLAGGEHVVAIELDPTGRFVAEAKATGTPVLIRDMTDDLALADAGIEHARVVVIATNNDLANLEVALDSRRMNPKVRVVMRLFDQRIADKFKDVKLIDEAFSAAALAAPKVADLARRR
jgi:hypothetical protein